MDALSSLNDIGLAFDTDKASSTHGYLAQYERFFERMRHDKITILEIGVLGGASLRTWEAYFPNAKIIGADIDFQTKRFERGRICIELIDQSNLQDLADLALLHAPFDIIIEDGSHFWEHQITTLRTLFPFVKNGGIYIIEDLQTNFGDMAPKYRGVANMSCVEYLKRLVDYQVGDEQTDLAAEEDAFLRTYGRSANLIAFLRHACIIEKRVEKKIRGYENSALEAPVNGEMAGHLRLVAHVGNFGDIESRNRPFVQSAVNGASFIQGFAIFSEALAPEDLSYRAKLSDGRWTGWVGLGEFVGTKGISQDLMGISVRLSPRSAASFTLAVWGIFGVGQDPVIAGDGEDCVASDETSLLRGIQLILRLRDTNTGLETFA